MRKSKFTEEQMVRILRQADERNPADGAKEHGVSKQTPYVWRKKFRGMLVDHVKRLQQAAEKRRERLDGKAREGPRGERTRRT